MKDDTLFVEKLALRTAESSLSVDGAVQHYLTTPLFNLQITSDKLSLPEIARLVPALAGVQLQPAFELKVDGPIDRLDVDDERALVGRADDRAGRRRRPDAGAVGGRATSRSAISTSRRS